MELYVGFLCDMVVEVVNIDIEIVIRILYLNRKLKDGIVWRA